VVRALCYLLLVALWRGAPAPAYAHGEPIDLAFWGNFTRVVASCQREIGHAGAQCGLGAWAARDDCFRKELQGGTCDEDAVSAFIDAVPRRNARQAVMAACSDSDVSMLQFLSLFEVQSDVTRFCRDLENAATSAVYGPFLSGTALDDAARTCIGAAADASTNLLRASFRSRRLVLDRIASNAVPAPAKTVLVARSDRLIERASQVLGDRIRTVCAEEEFAAVYGRDIDTYLAQMASRADCLAGDTYAQGTLLCPASVCGNGMQEPGEGCDDGNTTDGDGCSADCRLQ
jgi:cysteine-rich repeat protein